MTTPSSNKDKDTDSLTSYIHTHVTPSLSCISGTTNHQDTDLHDVLFYKPRSLMSTDIIRFLDGLQLESAFNLLHKYPGFATRLKEVTHHLQIYV